MKEQVIPEAVFSGPAQYGGLLPEEPSIGSRVKHGGSDRRPLRFWQPFNDWWRTEYAKTNTRPTSDDIERWYASQAEIAWGTDKPTLQEARVHAKCLRPVALVRDYFRDYRAKKRSEHDDDDDDDDAIGGDSDFQLTGSPDLRKRIRNSNKRCSRDAHTPVQADRSSPASFNQQPGHAGTTKRRGWPRKSAMCVGQVDHLQWYQSLLAAGMNAAMGAHAAMNSGAEACAHDAPAYFAGAARIEAVNPASIPYPAAAWGPAMGQLQLQVQQWQGQHWQLPGQQMLSEQELLDQQLLDQQLPKQQWLPVPGWTGQDSQLGNRQLQRQVMQYVPNQQLSAEQQQQLFGQHGNADIHMPQLQLATEQDMSKHKPCLEQLLLSPRGGQAANSQAQGAAGSANDAGGSLLSSLGGIDLAGTGSIGLEIACSVDLAGLQNLQPWMPDAAGKEGKAQDEQPADEQQHQQHCQVNPELPEPRVDAAGQPAADAEVAVGMVAEQQQRHTQAQRMSGRQQQQQQKHQQKQNKRLPPGHHVLVPDQLHQLQQLQHIQHELYVQHLQLQQQYQQGTGMVINQQQQQQPWLVPETLSSTAFVKSKFSNSANLCCDDVVPPPPALPAQALEGHVQQWRPAESTSARGCSSNTGAAAAIPVSAALQSYQQGGLLNELQALKDPAAVTAAAGSDASTAERQQRISAFLDAHVLGRAASSRLSQNLDQLGQWVSLQGVSTDNLLEMFPDLDSFLAGNGMFADTLSDILGAPVMTPRGALTTPHGPGNHAALLREWQSGNMDTTGQQRQAAAASAPEALQSAVQAFKAQSSHAAAAVPPSRPNTTRLPAANLAGGSTREASPDTAAVGTDGAPVGIGSALGERGADAVADAMALVSRCKRHRCSPLKLVNGDTVHGANSLSGATVTPDIAAALAAAAAASAAGAAAMAATCETEAPPQQGASDKPGSDNLEQDRVLDLSTQLRSNATDQPGEQQGLDSKESQGSQGSGQPPSKQLQAQQQEQQGRYRSPFELMAGSINATSSPKEQAKQASPPAHGSTAAAGENSIADNDLPAGLIATAPALSTKRTGVCLDLSDPPTPRSLSPIDVIEPAKAAKGEVPPSAAAQATASPAPTAAPEAAAEGSTAAGTPPLGRGLLPAMHEIERMI